MYLNPDNAQFAAEWLEKAFQRQSQKASLSRMLLVTEATVEIAQATRQTAFSKYAGNMLWKVISLMKRRKEQGGDASFDFVNISLLCLEKFLHLNISSAGLSLLVNECLELVVSMGGELQKNFIKILCGALAFPGVLEGLSEGSCVQKFLLMYENGQKDGVSNEIIYLLGLMLVQSNVAQFSQLFVTIIRCYIYTNINLEGKKMCDMHEKDVLKRTRSCLNLMLKLTRGSLREKNSSNVLRPVQSLLSILGTGTHTAINNIENKNCNKKKEEKRLRMEGIIDLITFSIIGRCALEGLSMKTFSKIDTAPLIRISLKNEKWQSIYTAQTRIPFDIIDLEIENRYDKMNSMGILERNLEHDDNIESFVTDRSVTRGEDFTYIAGNVDTAPSTSPEKIKTGLSKSANDLEILLATATSKMIEGQLRGKSSTDFLDRKWQDEIIIKLLSLFSYRASRTVDVDGLVTRILSSGTSDIILRKAPNPVAKQQKMLQSKCAALCSLNAFIGKSLFRKIVVSDNNGMILKGSDSFLLSFLSRIIRNSEIATRVYSTIVLTCNMCSEEKIFLFMRELITLTKLGSEYEQSEGNLHIRSGRSKKISEDGDDEVTLLMEDYIKIYSTVPSFESSYNVLKKISAEREDEYDEEWSAIDTMEETQKEEESAVILSGSVSLTSIDISSSDGEEVALYSSNSEDKFESSVDNSTNGREAYSGDGRATRIDKNNMEKGHEKTISDCFNIPKMTGQIQQQRVLDYCREAIRAISCEEYFDIELYTFAVQFVVLCHNFGEYLAIDIISTLLLFVLNNNSLVGKFMLIFLSLLKMKTNDIGARSRCDVVLGLVTSLDHSATISKPDDNLKYLKIEEITPMDNVGAPMEGVQHIVQKEISTMNQAIEALVTYIFDDSSIDLRAALASERWTEANAESSESGSSTSISFHRPSVITRDMLRGRAAVYRGSGLTTLTTHTLDAAVPGRVRRGAGGDRGAGWARLLLG